MSKKAVQTKEMIKNKTYYLFADRGFSTVTMGDICAVCELSRGGLYRHYGSTQEIFEAILESISREEENFIQDGIQKGISAQIILEQILDKMKQEMLEKENSLSYAIYEYSCTCKKNFMIERNQKAKEKWRVLLKYGIYRGEFEKVNIEQMTDLILYSYQGIRMWSRVIPIEKSVADHIIDKIRKDLVKKMKKFELREWKFEDALDIIPYANNKHIAANLRNVFPYPYTQKDAEEYIHSCIENDGKQQICRAIIVDGKAVGSIGIFLGADVYEKSGELGYWLAEEYWGQGIMTEAVKEICKEAWEHFSIVRIYAEPFAYNTGSRRVLEKAGFSLEGIMHNGVYKYGEVFDYCMYALLKKE